MHAVTPRDHTPKLDQPSRPQRRPPRRTRRLVAVLAAGALTAGGAVVLVQSRDLPTAHAVLMTAAQRTGAVTSLEGSATQIRSESHSTSHIQMNGDNFKVVTEGRYSDGHREGSTFVAIDDTGYETVEGQTTASPLDPQDRLEPFGKASAAVVLAALEGSNVVQRGDETVHGVVTSRYQIELTRRSIAALSALPPSQLAWFEFENPGEVQGLTVWVGAGLVRQIEIKSGDRATRAEFFNFNTDIRITAPPGPYTTSGER